jgi:hypothetical protein
MTRVPWGAVIAVCALLAGTVVFVGTNGVVETITAAAIVVAVGSVAMRLVKSLG